jgi:hypothetical protein
MLPKQNELKENLKNLARNTEKEIKKMEDKMASASDEGKLQLQSTINEIKEEKRKIDEKSREVANATRQNWDELKSQTDDVLKKAEAKVYHLADSVKNALG